MVFEFIREVVSEGQKYNIIFTQEEDLKALKNSVEGDLAEDWRCHKILDFLVLILNCSLFGKKRLKNHLFSLEVRNAHLFLCLFLLLWLQSLKSYLRQEFLTFTWPLKSVWCFQSGFLTLFTLSQTYISDNIWTQHWGLGCLRPWWLARGLKEIRTGHCTEYTER